MRRTKNRLDQYFKKVHLIFDRVIIEYFGKQKFNRAGRIYVKCCFHQEKTPSLVFNRKMRIFLCYGCGVGGNIVTFIKLMEGLRGSALLSFIEKKYGLPMPHRRRFKPLKDYRSEVKLTDEEKKLRKINKMSSVASDDNAGYSYSSEANAIMQLIYRESA